MPLEPIYPKVGKIFQPRECWSMRSRPAAGEGRLKRRGAEAPKGSMSEIDRKPFNPFDPRSNPAYPPSALAAVPPTTHQSDRPLRRSVDSLGEKMVGGWNETESESTR